MQGSDIPAKIALPFAAAAGAAYVRAVPLASQIGAQNGAASLTDGFPPACFVPIAAGGSWPFGQDMNGILNQVTAWLRWHQAGGPVRYDAAFSASVGGYPLGALLWGAQPGVLWQSHADGNATNPDAGGAGWVNIIPDFTAAIAAQAAAGSNEAAIRAAADSNEAAIRAAADLLLTPRSLFTSGFSGLNYGWTRGPDGIIDQTVSASVPGGTGALITTLLTLPIAFPGGPLDAIISYVGNTPPPSSGLSAQPYSASQVSVTTNIAVASVVPWGVVVRARGY